MADKEIRVKITTEADISSLDDLRDVIEQVQDSQINLEVITDNSGLDETAETAEGLDGKDLDMTANVDDESVRQTADDLDDIDGKTVEPTVNVDSSGVDEVSEEIDDLDGRTVEVGADVDAGGLDDLNEGLDEADEKAQQLADDMGLINADVTLDIADKIGGMGASAENAAQEMNTAAISVGQLATNVGMAEPQMVSLINNISNATFPQNEAMAYVESLNQMGVSADKLGASATNMDKINDATGIGYQKTLQLTQGLRSMGVSADNLPSSFNAIAYAEANVNGGADTLATVLKRQAGTLNEYGLSVDQTVLIMQKLSESGVSATKMGSALSSALKDANGDTAALEQSLGMAEGTLSSAGDATSQYSGQLQALADEEAEHKTIIDQAKAAYEDLTLAMSPVLEPAASFMGIIGQAGSYAVGINGLFQLKDNIGKLSIAKTAGGWMSSLKTSVGGVGSKFVEAGGKMLSFARDLAGTVAGAVKNAITSFMSLGKEVLTAGLNALKSAGMWLVQKAQLIATSLWNGIVTATQWALNLAMSMNPIMLVVIAIGLLIAALAYLYFNNEQVRQAIDGLGQALWNIGTIIYGYLQQAWDTITSTLQSVWSTVTTIASNFVNIIIAAGMGIIQNIFNVLMFIATLPTRIGMYLASVISKAVSFASGFVSNMVSAGSRAVSNFFTYISQIPGKLATELNNALNKVGEWAATLPQKFWDAGVNAVKNFLSALGIASPGTMQRMLVWEVSEMGRRVPDEGKSLISNIGALGEDVVSQFGNPQLSVGIDDNVGDFDFNTAMTGTMNEALSASLDSENTGETTVVQNVTFEGCTFDKDERVQEILDVVRYELNWDNRRAGRTV